MINHEDIEAFKEYVREYCKANPKGVFINIKIQIGKKEKKAKVYFVDSKERKKELLEKRIPAVEVSELDRLLNTQATPEEEAEKILKEALDSVKAIADIMRMFNGKIIQITLL